MNKRAILFLAMLAAPIWAQDLESGFRNPPEATKPRCYWYWLNGNITKEGITKDLEAMKRVGIGEGYIGIIDGGEVKALTDEWWGLIQHAVREGTRLDVNVGLFNSPGWSQSGGPWVKPSQAMRYVVFPELRLRGPQHFEGKLPAPAGDFQDIAVLAFPAPQGDADDAAAHGAKITRTPKAVTWELPAPFTARSVTIRPAKAINVACELQAGDDGKTFRTLRKFTADRHHLVLNVGPVPLAPIVISFPAATAKFFRLQFSAGCDPGEITLLAGARVESYPDKQLQKMFQAPQPPFDFYTWPRAAEPEAAGLVVKPDAVQDITAHLSADGTLKWDVPAGEWVILRSAMTPTGTKNSPAPPEATGLEVDKMNREALKAHFDAYVGKLLADLPPEQRKSFRHVVADSYEMGPENWTDGFAAQFRQRYGYDPLKYLPAMTGRIVGSAEQSDRFLWDLRRLIADRVSYDYVGGLRDLCHAHGLRMWLENYGHWGFPGEFLQYGGQCDEISGEFWATGDLGSVELRDASSAAHIYGMKSVYAEAFTGGPLFQSTPWSLKKRGDWAFCQGINHFVLHVYIHQPWEDKKPGMSAWYGTEFNRHNTWFEMSRAWIDYLRRCHFLLQQGVHVADVAYFIGEDTPKMAGLQEPPLPEGYDFDYINAEVLLQRAAVRGKRLVLPDGMSYRVLVLPPSETMRPEVLKQIAAFAREGLAVVGAPPTRSPSLQNFPQCDGEIRKLADELWGKGLIKKAGDPKAAISDGPDVKGIEGKPILFTHRRSDDADIYFLSNQSDAPLDLAPVFRVAGKAAELWHPDSGQFEPTAAQADGGATRVPLHLEERGSVFVVFRGGAGSATIKTRPALREAMKIAGPWKVEIASRKTSFDKLLSWTDHADPAIKYFSGTAVYRTTFEWNGSQSPQVELDLGQVESLAEVTLNGQTLRALWKKPYRIDVTAAIRPGKNELAVAVVNTWNNRLVGDAALPPAKRQTWTAKNHQNSKTPLQPSGLLGPVVLLQPAEAPKKISDAKIEK